MFDQAALRDLIENAKSSGKAALGTKMDAPSVGWIEKISALIGSKHPASYLWFIGNYGGGEINGNEVFSIYGIDPGHVVGGDVAYQYLLHIKHGWLSNKNIPIMQGASGEIYFMDASLSGIDGEYPIFVKHGESIGRYSDNFAEFLIRQIQAGSSKS